MMMRKIKSKHFYFNKKIAYIKAIHNLKNAQIAKIVGKSERTIIGWLCSADNDNYRRAPEEAYRALIKRYEEN